MHRREARNFRRRMSPTLDPERVTDLGRRGLRKRGEEKATDFGWPGALCGATAASFGVWLSGGYEVGVEEPSVVSVGVLVSVGVAVM